MKREPREITGEPKTNILFVGEAVTSAHVIRPLGLALGMDPDRYRVTFACDPRHERMVTNQGVVFEPLPALASDVFMKRLDRGAALYTVPELRACVQDDLRLMAKVKPDVIVGDFRISMGIASELSDIPYLALSNLHWSPNVRLPVPIPEHPLVDLFGLRIGGRIIARMIPFFFGLQSRGVNRVRRAYGLAPIAGRGAPEVYTHGTRTLYLDVPDLYGAQALSETEHCIGPVPWIPPMDLPSWWNELPTERPVAWVSAGSSGDSGVMEEAARALIHAGWTVMVATAKRMRAPTGAYAADFIPGTAAAERADLVVCNGGSAQTYQALACGKPVLGIPRNMDQYYMMEGLVRRGAGRLLRIGQATGTAIRDCAQAMLKNQSLHREAERLAAAIRKGNPADELDRIVRRLPAAAPGHATASVPRHVTARITGNSACVSAGSAV